MLKKLLKLIVEYYRIVNKMFYVKLEKPAGPGPVPVQEVRKLVVRISCFFCFFAEIGLY